MSSIELPPDLADELARLSRLVLSPLATLQHLKSESPAFESLAWQALGVWDLTTPVGADYGLINTDVVEPVLKDIVVAYGLDELEDTLKAAAYLGFRARFLNHEHAVWEGGAWWTIECQYDPYYDGDSPPAPDYFGLVYRRTPAPMGDIVGFEKIDPARFTPDPLFPIDSFWQVLRADYECPSGLVSYEVAYREARKALSLHIVQRRQKLELCSGIEHLRGVLKDLVEADFSKDGVDKVRWVSLLAHALVLGAL